MYIYVRGHHYREYGVRARARYYSRDAEFGEICAQSEIKNNVQLYTPY